MKKTLKIMAASILFVLCLHSQLMAQDQLQNGISDVETLNSVQLVEHLGGQVNGIYPYGNLLFAIIGPDFTILDISDPKNPTRIGYLTNLGYQTDIIVSGDFAFVSAGREGMYVIDISDLSRPKLAYNFKASGFTTGLAQYMDFVVLIYVSESGGEPGFQIIDISKPNQPREIANVKIADFNPTDIVVKDGFGYVVGSKSVGDLNDDGVLRVYDLRIPQSPKELGEFYDSASGFQRIEVKEKYAYIPVAYVGLDIVDISNPQTPTLAKSLSVAKGYVGDLAVSSHDSQLYLTSGVSPGEGGFHVFDIHHAPNITQTAYLSETLLTKVAVSGTLAFVGQYSTGLQIIDSTIPESLGLFSTQADLDAYEWAHDSKIKQGNYVYQLTSTQQANDTLQVLDIATPNNPVEIAKYFSPYVLLQSLALQDNNLFVSFLDINASKQDASSPPTSKRGILIFDVNQSFANQPISRIEMPNYGGIPSIELQGRYLFFADNYTMGPINLPQSSLRIVDILDIYHPKIIASYDTNKEIKMIAINNDKAYLLFSQIGQGSNCRGGLALIDISLIEQPKDIGIACTNGASAFIVDNGYAYLASGNDGLVVIDVSIPTAPKIVGANLLTPGAGRIAKSNNIIAIDDWLYGLFLFKFHPMAITATITDTSIVNSSVDSTVYEFSTPPLGVSSIFTHTTRFADDAKAFSQPLLGIGHYFSNDFDAVNQSRELDSVRPYSVTIYYSDDEIQHVNESTLAVYYWNGTQWQQNLTSIVDPNKNQITATLSKAGVWGVAGQFLSRNYLPIISSQ